MVFLLVMLTFGICVLIDRLTRPQSETSKSIWIQPDHAYQRTLGTEQYVEGYRFRETVQFHQGHMWVKTEGQYRARIGLDDFICKLKSPITAIEHLPESKLRQGAPCLKVYIGDHHIDILAPIGGKIIATNGVHFQDPTQITQDPFVAWLFLVENKNLSTEQNNLIHAEWAFTWMKQEAARLRFRQKMGLQIDEAFLNTFFDRQASPCSGH